MKTQLTERDYEQLSAYIDGQLAPRERERLEARLSAQPELQTALEDLNRTRTLLRQAPRRRAPRNFTLTPAMAEQIRPRKRKNNAWTLFPALGFASALATLLLVASFVFQMLPSPAMTAQQGAPASRQMEDTGATNSATAPQATVQAEAPALAAGAPSEKKTEPGAAGAAPAAAGTPAAAEAMAAAPNAGDQFGSVPPVVAWNGNSPYSVGGPAMGMGGGGGGDGLGGGGVPSSSSLLGPPQAPVVGNGKESGQPIIYGVPMDAGGAPINNLTLPPESLNSLPDAARSADSQPVQPNPAISGSGPILGVPEQGQEGQIVEQRALLGQPSTGTQPADSSAAVPGSTAEAPQAAAARQAPVSLPVLQGLLAAIALITGAAAVILWRRRG